MFFVKYILFLIKNSAVTLIPCGNLFNKPPQIRVLVEFNRKKPQQYCQCSFILYLIKKHEIENMKRETHNCTNHAQLQAQLDCPP